MQKVGSTGNGRIVKGPVVNKRLQDMQELVHQDAQGLHFCKWVVLPPLQMRIEGSEVIIVLDQAQAAK